MNAYYYFLFRIYWLYKDNSKETDSQALFSATAVSTTVLCFHLITIYFLMNYYGLVPIITNKFLMVVFMLGIGFLNHYFFVKDRRFLNQDYRKDKKGGYLIVAFIVFTFSLDMIVANINRERIFRENAGKVSDEPPKGSLEGDIRKWLE